MTPADWLTSTDPDGMLQAVRDRAPDRKLLLFACGAARRVWDRLLDFGHNAVPLVEEAADSGGSDEDLRATVWAAFESTGLPREAVVEWLFPEGDPISESIRRVTGFLRALEETPDNPGEDRVTQLIGVLARMNPSNPVPHTGQSDLLRCVLGQPFPADEPPPPRRGVLDLFRRRAQAALPPPPAFDPAWRTEAAVDLARVIYHDREFELMPILADALQDAGCVDEAALAHCRGPGPHARGCWVVDQVLGKS